MSIDDCWHGGEGDGKRAIVPLILTSFSVSFFTSPLFTYLVLPMRYGRILTSMQNLYCFG